MGSVRALSAGTLQFTDLAYGNLELKHLQADAPQNGCIPSLGLDGDADLLSEMLKDGEEILEVVLRHCGMRPQRQPGPAQRKNDGADVSERRDGVIHAKMA